MSTVNPCGAPWAPAPAACEIHPRGPIVTDHVSGEERCLGCARDAEARMERSLCARIYEERGAAVGLLIVVTSYMVIA